MEKTNFEEKFKSFYEGCVEIYLKYMTANGYENQLEYNKMSYTEGKRYMKVIRGGSVHLFVDKNTGDVLKAASWNVPAKGARGNIFDEHNGLKRVGPHGAEYNRG